MVNQQMTRCRRFGKPMAAKTLAAYYDHSCKKCFVAAFVDSYYKQIK